MTDPYLIAHLVRGQPAFDIAIRTNCCVCHANPTAVSFLVPTTEDCTNCGGLGYDWMIPTSGHRAYPYWFEPLLPIVTGISSECDAEYVTYQEAIPEPPADFTQDHYSPSAAPRGQGLITNLAERLGFITKPKVSRR